MLRQALSVDCILDGLERDDLQWSPRHDQLYRRVYWTTFGELDAWERYDLVVMASETLEFADERRQVAFERLLRRVGVALLVVGAQRLHVRELPAWLRAYEPTEDGGALRFEPLPAARVVVSHETVARENALGLVAGSRLVLAANGRRYIDFELVRHPWSAVLEFRDAQGLTVHRELLYDESGAAPRVVTIDARHSPTLELRVEAHAPAQGTEAWLLNLESLTCA